MIIRDENYFTDKYELTRTHSEVLEAVKVVKPGKTLDLGCGNGRNSLYLAANGYDVDAPTSFQLDILKKDLILLSEGRDIKAPMYLPNGTGVSLPNAQDIHSQKIIVVEGIATMYEDVQDIFDIKIYVEADNDIRKSRFMARACKERNQSEDNALKHWDYITNAGEKYVKPFRNQADLILNGNADLDYFAEILEYIYAITNNFEQ